MMPGGLTTGKPYKAARFATLSTKYVHVSVLYASNVTDIDFRFINV